MIAGFRGGVVRVGFLAQCLTFGWATGAIAAATAEPAEASLPPTEPLDVFNDTDILQTGRWILFAVALVGVVLALVEREKNTQRFGGPLPHGIATGMWWAAAAMTTPGDSEVTPRTRSGRLVAIVRMFERSWQGILHASPLVLDPISCAIGFPPDTALRASIDRTPLDIIEEERWRAVELRYLGHH
jgi:hypothetical protein